MHPSICIRDVDEWLSAGRRGENIFVQTGREIIL